MALDGLVSLAAATGWVAISQKDESDEYVWALVAWGLMEKGEQGRSVVGLVYPSPGDGVINAEDLPGFGRYEYRGPQGA